ncbi:MAG: hypothetical protein KDK38_11200 [Leptospiraceae bacterium]|nr:hypothetical protein [Leptospiraceae bacterium]
MNKQKALEELEELRKRADELERIIKEPERKGIYEQPDTDYTYFVNHVNVVCESSIPIEVKNSYTAFSREKAKEEKARRNVETKLYRLAAEREKTHPIDWNNQAQRKFHFLPRWDHEENKPCPKFDYWSFIETEHPSYVGFHGNNQFMEFIRENLTEQEITDYCRPRRFV